MEHKRLMSWLSKKLAVLTVILITIIGYRHKASTDLLLADGEQYAERWEYVDVDSLAEPYIVYCDTIVAPDDRLAFITWDTGMGGISPDIRNIAVWRDNDGNVYRRECSVRGMADGFDEKAEGCFVFGIDTIVHEDKTIYLVISMYREASMTQNSIMIEALGIDGKHIVSVPLFDVDREICSKIEFGYNRFEWAEKNVEGGEWYGPISIQSDGRAILIPYMAFDSESYPMFTDTFTVYRREAPYGFYEPQAEPFIKTTTTKQ